MLPYLVSCLSALVIAVGGDFNCSDGKAVEVSDTGDVTIGFLSSFKHHGGMAKKIAGAVPLAVEDVNAKPDLLPNRTLKFLARDTGEPETAVAIRKMTELRDKGVVAFIGPDHSCASEALVAAAWRLPMIAFKCSDLKVSFKDIYPTFARTLPPSSKVSKSLVALLLHYSWRKVVLVVAQNPSDIQAKEAVVTLAKEHGITITATYYIPGNYVRVHYKNLTEIVDKSSMLTRVYVILADDYAVVDFARYMHEEDLLGKGEYIIIAVEDEQMYNPKNLMQFIRKEFEAPYQQKSAFDRNPFRSVLMLTPTYRIKLDWQAFEDKVRNYSTRPPFKIKFHPDIKVTVPIHAAMVYDAIMIYARAATEVLQMNLSLTDGDAIFERIRSRAYDSVLGFSVAIDANGDAEGNYSLLALQYSNFTSSSEKYLQPVGFFARQANHNGLPTLKLEKDIEWIVGPPAAEPECGFFNEHCVFKPDWTVILICSVCIIVLITVALYAFRHYRYEHKLACLLWKIEMKDVTLICPNSDSTALQNMKNNYGFETSRFCALRTSQEEEDPMTGRTPHKLGIYKGNVVYIKPVYKKCIDITRSICKEMIQIREMRQENINPFIGACVDPPNICIISLFCARGSLKDVLKNSDINLDTVFVASLVADLIKGMTYIHDGEIVSHGNLKSSNCLVDSRWVLQLTDFGLHEFKADQELPNNEQIKYLKGLLWTAPELLRAMNPPARGSQKGDVYSFGIILHEIVSRKGPWELETSPIRHKCIIERVINPLVNGGKIFRPSAQELDCPECVTRCMEECWDEDPELRPDFRTISVKLREVLSEVKTNIFDNMIAIMEKYACNLEGLVQERTKLLMEEKKKTENLLLRMLPKSVAEQLKRGEQVEAESFDCVTIYFSDIVGFTALSAVSTPLEVVDLLNDLYTCFDSIIGNYDVYKVETIGDAYMVVSGLPIRNGANHAAEIASMALHLLSRIRTFEIRHRPGERLKLRIGVHSGPCVAGVVGLKMPRYCLFGDTVNTASRMESTGEPLRIHVSSSCKEILDNFEEFELQERGLTQVKGKGEMRTYWLIGRKPRQEQLSPLISVSADDEMKARRYTDSRLMVRNPYELKQLFAPEWQTRPNQVGELELSPKTHNSPNGIDKRTVLANSKTTYSSCKNLLQEYKKNFWDMKLSGKLQDAACCSAPSINLKQSPTDEAVC